MYGIVTRCIFFGVNYNWQRVLLMDVMIWAGKEVVLDMPSMEKLKTRILAGELSNNEESLNKKLLGFASYRDITQGRYVVYRKLCDLLTDPECTVSIIWKETFHLMLDTILKERDMQQTGIFEACRDIISQWGGTGDDVISMIRLSGLTENCHDSWRLYLENASFLEGMPEEEEADMKKEKFYFA